jgi:hypothetical protein
MDEVVFLGVETVDLSLITELFEGGDVLAQVVALFKGV